MRLDGREFFGGQHVGFDMRRQESASMTVGDAAPLAMFTLFASEPCLGYPYSACSCMERGMMIVRVAFLIAAGFALSDCSTTTNGASQRFYANTSSGSSNARLTSTTRLGYRLGLKF
jgi:hypothetical protein